MGGGLCPLFWGGAESPPNTKSPGPRPTSIPSGILNHPAIWPQRTLVENWGRCSFFLGGGEWGPHLTRCGCVETYVRAKFHLNLSNRVATIHQLHRQTDRQDRHTGQDRTTVREHRANRFTNRRPINVLIVSTMYVLRNAYVPIQAGP